MTMSIFEKLFHMQIYKTKKSPSNKKEAHIEAITINYKLNTYKRFKYTYLEY